MLRIDINMLFTVINVLILVVAVRLLLWKPIHRILEQRQAEAEAGMAQADEQLAQAQALALQNREQLEGIEQQRAAVMEQARTAAGAESQRILDSARSQARDILAEAEAAAQRRREDTLRETHAQIEEIIMTAASKMAGAGGDSALYDEFIEKAGKADE